MHAEALPIVEPVGERLDLSRLLGRPAWHAEAACRGQTDLFFKEGRGVSHAAAKQLCATCPVIDACQAYALTHPTPAGVWGGWTVRERLRLRGAAKRARRAA